MGVPQRNPGNENNWPVTGSEYYTVMIDSFSKWDGLAGQWNELLTSSRSDTLFLTWEWLRAWADCFLNEKRLLFIVAVYCGGELVGLAPWCINEVNRLFGRIRQIEFLGTPEGGSDYLDVIIKKGKEERVAHILYEFLFRSERSSWDMLCLTDLPSDSFFLLHFQDRVERDGKFIELRRGSCCPFVPIPDGEDWVPGSVSQKRKARFRQDLGKLKKGGAVLHEVINAPGETEVREFYSFYAEKTAYEYRSLLGFMQKYALSGAGPNGIRIDYLNIGGVRVAGFLHFRYRDATMLYAMAVDKGFNPKISSGNVLVGLCLEKAHAERQTVYDFLKGHEPYKFYWTDSCRMTVSLFTVQAKPKPLFFLSALFIKNLAKVLMR